ncbi:MAG: ABC-2 family transporter protein [Candidatus Daviesbacteria bacterium]|nr:ABC-2 family transporter protein [Candidatus Daviesbacteria bacterium]
MKEFRVWLKLTTNTFQQVLTNKFLMGLFLIAKLLRISLFLLFLHFLFQGTDNLAGYSKDQIIFFYLSFNLVDSLSQTIFREVYRFRELILSGRLDFVLIKPINPLIRTLLGGSDLMDLFILGLILSTTIWYGLKTDPTFLNWLLYLVLILNSLLIAASFHIFVLGMGIISTTVDHMIMVYRDLVSLGRIPVDLYIQPIRAILTFVIPLGVMMTFPAKVLMGLLSPEYILISILLSLTLFYLSLRFWGYSLKHYQSAGG